MEKNKRIKIELTIITIIAVIVIGVAFAAYSAALNIEGAGTIKSANWEVRFENLSSATLTGSAIEKKRPTINANDTYISNYDVTFFSPGDSISYTFDVANNGTFDAEITTFQISTPTCAGNGANASVEAEKVCSNLNYTLTYADGGAINMGDVLPSNSKKSMKLTLTYGVIGDEIVPQRDVKISNLNVSIIYAQK